MVEYTVRVYRDPKTKKVKQEITNVKNYNYYSKGKMPFNRLISDLFKI